MKSVHLKILSTNFGELQKIYPTINSCVISRDMGGKEIHFPKSRVFCRPIDEFCRPIDEFCDQSTLSNHSVIIWKLYLKTLLELIRERKPFIFCSLEF